jgi:hypothetical protein
MSRRLLGVAGVLAMLFSTGGLVLCQDVQTTTTTVRVQRPAGYDVPMLGIPGFKINNTTRMRINFSGDLAGSHANAFIRPRSDGTTEVKVHFHDLKRSRSADERIVVWAVAPDNHFVKIGQAMSSGFRSETEIKGETSMKDFGLFITAETADVEGPTRTVLGTFTIIK